MKGKNLQQRLFYPTRILFRIEREIKFTEKQKLTNFSSSKPALKQILKELLYAGNIREEKDLQSKLETIEY